MAAKKQTFDTLEQIRQAKQAPRESVPIQVTEGVSVDFVMRGVGRKTLRDLIAAHPRGDDDLPAAQWNSETFPPALIAASCDRPPMSEADVVDMFGDGEWTQGDLQALFAAALKLST